VRPLVALLDAREHQDLVVHREPEQGAEEEDGQAVIDGARRRDAEVALLEHPHEAPNELATDTKFMRMALIGRTIEPSRRKRITNVIVTTKPTARGVLSRKNSVASMFDAVSPPTHSVPSRTARSLRSLPMTSSEAGASGALSRSA